MRLTRLEDRVAPAVATWDGGGSNDNWTTAANWVGDFAPHAGDDLVFPAFVSFPVFVSRTGNVNDFPAGTAFGSIRMAHSAYVITGNAITLLAGFTIPDQADSARNPQLGLDITLAAPQSFSETRAGAGGLTLTGAIDLNGQTLTVTSRSTVFPSYSERGALVFEGPVRGAGGLVIDGGGTVVLKGSNTYTGPTDVRSGRLVLKSGGALGATGAGNDTNIGHDGTLGLSFANSQDPIPEVMTFAAHDSGKNSLETFMSGNLSGTLTLAGPNLFSTDDLTISGVVRETGSPQELTLFTGNLLGGGPFPFGSTRIVFAPGSVVDTGIKILHGEVRFDGTGTKPVTGQDGRVTGDGSVGPVNLGSGAGVAPAKTADDPLSTLTINGDLTLDENGPIGLTIAHILPDGRSDAVSVRGAVRLGGELHLPYRGNAGPLVAGSRFRIIDNDGTDAVVGTFRARPEGSIVGSVGGRYLRVTYRGGDGNDVDLVADVVETPGRVAVGAGAGGLPLVNVYDGAGLLLRSFLAYDAGFRGGVRVATADFTRDGFPDIVTAPGPGGGPHVKIFDGLTGVLLVQFMAYDPAFLGGVYLATGSVSIAGALDLVTAAGAGGGPHVKVYYGFFGTFPYNTDPVQGLNLYRSFFAYDPQFAGGVTVAAGDTDGDGLAEVITGPATTARRTCGCSTLRIRARGSYGSLTPMTRGSLAACTSLPPTSTGTKRRTSSRGPEPAVGRTSASSAGRPGRCSGSFSPTQRRSVAAWWSMPST